LRIDDGGKDERYQEPEKADQYGYKERYPPSKVALWTPPDNEHEERASYLDESEEGEKDAKAEESIFEGREHKSGGPNITELPGD